MSWFKKEQPNFSIGASIEQRHEALDRLVYQLQQKINDLEFLKISHWCLQNTCEQKEHELIFREPNSYFSGYSKRIEELEKLGWHIKRVSDCGKYEIWMPGK